MCFYWEIADPLILILQTAQSKMIMDLDWDTRTKFYQMLRILMENIGYGRSPAAVGGSDQAVAG